MRNKILRESLLLKKFYETEVEPTLKYPIPFEYLYEDELESLSNSFWFARFKLRESISQLQLRDSVEKFLTKIANALKK